MKNNFTFYKYLIYIVIIVGLMIGGYLLYNKSIDYFNYTRFLRETNDQLQYEIKVRDSIYEELSLQKNKTIVIRQKINTSQEEEKIKLLEKKLELLRFSNSNINKDTSNLLPEELTLYFEKILK